MLLAKILKNVRYMPLNDARVDIPIASLCDDTRKVSAGCLFICICGARFDPHGAAAEIISKGAAAVIVERIVDTENLGAPCLLVENARLALAIAAANFYAEALSKMTLVGVTGTNGKTSVTYFIESILREAGKTAGVIGTVGVMAGARRLPLSFSASTTPDTLELMEILTALSGEGVRYAVMEVSSHALAQERTGALLFKTGVFTNLTRDHLDYHETMENYFSAKARLFNQCERGVINLDDAYGEKLINMAPCEILTFGVKKKADITAGDIAYSREGVRFTIKHPDGAETVNIPVPGSFTVYNALAAVSACLASGVSINAAIRGAERVSPVPGRFQSIPNDKNISVIVDYAHTPDGLTAIIESVKLFSKRVITVFGAGGDRDRAKRPMMGAAAGRLSDYCVLTNDNPRGEDPLAIIAEIEDGVRAARCEYAVIPDRESAIARAIERAEAGDAVIIAGKGHEDYQEAGGKKIYFSDAQIAAKILGKCLK